MHVYVYGIYNTLNVVCYILSEYFTVYIYTSTCYLPCRRHTHKLHLEYCIYTVYIIHVHAYHICVRIFIQLRFT